MKSIIQTENFYLRPFTTEDLDFLYQLHSNPKVAKTTIDGIQDLKTVTKHLEEFIAHQEKFGFSQWAVFENNSNKFSGRAGLVKRSLNKEIGVQTEIRFAIMPEFWGRGVASQITKALVSFAKNTLELKTLVASNSLANEKSARILIKNGFVHTKNIIPEGYANSEKIRYWELNF